MADKQTNFIPISGRDAYATIRGYRYQIDVTISRWLSLEQDEELQLECGEDIDRIQKEVLAGNAEIQRVLEQVKRREKPLTLNTPEALQALASFTQHRANNPGRRVSFQYLTNSEIGREYRSRLPNGEAAIEVWQKLRRGELSGDELSAALSGIRAIISGATKPSKFDDAQWAGLQTFVTSAKDHSLLEYINSFEWRVKAPDFLEMPEKIKGELFQAGRAASKHASNALYDRLFLFVVRRLSEQGPKILTLAELDSICSRPTIEPGDQLLLGFVRTLISLLEDRFRSVEEKAIGNRQYLERIEADVGLLVQQSEIRGVVDYAARGTTLDVPPSVERVAKRAAAVNKILELLHGKVWCALTGQVSAGKTQFAILVTKALKRPTFWVGMRGLDAWQSCLRLEQALAQASNLSPKRELRRWYSAVCGALPSGSVIVLDDLPGIISSGDFELRLLLLGEACSQIGCTLISTSNEELPASLRECAGRNLVAARIPFFDREEAKELFLAHEAPPEVLKPKFVLFLWSLTRGHPMLLMSLARHLLSSQWHITDKQLDGLFKGEYAEDVKSETRRLLVTTIKDPETRNLLYRLNLAGFSLEAEHVKLVGEVERRIDRPLERLAQIEGLWVQRDSGSRYLVSPLLSGLEPADVPRDTQQKVHEVLALSIVRKGKLVPLDVITAFTQFIRARQNERATGLLLLALSSLAGLEDPLSDDWQLSSIWAEQKLPDDISLGVQLYLRCQQVIVRGRLGKSTRYELEDFESLLPRVKADDTLGVAGACICLAAHFARKEPVRANRYLLTGIKALPDFRFTDGSRPEIPERARPEFLFLITGSAIRSETELTDWISSLEGLDDQTLSMLFTDESWVHAAVRICDHFWLEEDSKPRGSRDWDSVHQQLITLGNFAKRHNLQLLLASSLRARIIVQAEYQENLGTAVRLAEQALKEIGDDPRSVFLIREVTGRQFVYAKRWTEALEWLDAAVSDELDAFPLLRMRALLAAGEAASSMDTSRAIKYCESAVALAEKSPEILETQVVVALGERAIAHWQAGDRLSTYLSWEMAVQRLFDAKSDDEAWKKLLVMCGHVSGYFSLMASVGKPPTPEYVAPKPGMLSREYPDVLELYDPGREWALPAQLAQFAIAVGREEEAAAWALRAVESGRGGRNEELLRGLRLFAVCQAILDDRYGEALDIALEAGTAIAANYARSRHSMTHDEIPGGPATVSREDPTSTSGANGEKHAASYALTPIIFRLAGLWLNDRDSAREAARTVASECTRLASTAKNPRQWDEATRLVNEIFGQHPSWQQLNEQGNEYAERNENTLQILCYAGAILHVKPKDALKIQLTILPTLEQLLEHHGTFQRIVVPFVLQYWEQKMESSPYYFSSPALLKERLQGLSGLPSRKRLRRTLHEIAFGVGLTLTESERTWLK
jgi:hypothetical protein